MTGYEKAEEKIDAIFDTYDSDSPISRGRVIREILALMPDVEEAKREERERVVGVVRDIEYFLTDEFLKKYKHITRDLYFRLDLNELVQEALKGGK